MTKYITKADAVNVAGKLTKELTRQINAMSLEIGDLVSDIYLKGLPSEIRDLFKKYPNYFKKATEIRCEGNGLNDSFGLKNSVPSTGGWQLCILPSSTEAKSILKLTNSFEKLKTKRDSLSKQIEQTLLSLKTYNRIEKEFPEAFELLPDKVAGLNTLSIPLEDIRKQLKTIKT